MLRGSGLPTGLYPWSNTGRCVDMFAPGVDILAACGGAGALQTRPTHPGSGTASLSEVYYIALPVRALQGISTDRADALQTDWRGLEVQGFVEKWGGQPETS